LSLNGVFAPPGDKSISHRVALMSVLAHGEVRLTNFSPCADVASSLDAARLLGTGVQSLGDEISISGPQRQVKSKVHIDCGNSGTTMRLLMGILSGLSGEFTLDGDDSLRARPMERVALPLREMGARVLCESGKSPVTIHGGRLHGIHYDLPVASAQLKSAVLLAGIQANGTTSVREPAPSRDHTEKLFELLGARISRNDNAWQVESSTLTFPPFLYVPGDSSSAAFFLCSATIMPGADVTAERMLLNPTRIGFLNVLSRMGAAIEIEPGGREPETWGNVRALYSPDLAACRIEAQEIPSLVDEVPILALVATQARGTTVFEGVGELRIKESDRLAAIAGQLDSMGANIRAEGDTLVVDGPTFLHAPDRLESFGDHRIAMTLRLAGLLVGARPKIEGEESIVISYPGFHETLESLSS
jgi:3-phosphoshikimate 1-carboxyvinyltransferase